MTFNKLQFLVLPLFTVFFTGCLTAKTQHVLSPSAIERTDWVKIFSQSGSDNLREVDELFADDTAVYAVGCYQRGKLMFRSYDDGLTWNQIKFPGACIDDRQYSPYGSENTLFIRYSEQSYYSTDHGDNWNKFSDIGEGEVAVTQYGWFKLTHLGVHRSTNNGRDWEIVCSDLTNRGITITTSVKSGYLFFVSIVGDVIRFDASNNTWVRINDRIDGSSAINVISIKQDALLVDALSRLYVSTDCGENWRLVFRTDTCSSKHEKNHRIEFANMSESSTLFVYMKYYSSDFGVSWQILPRSSIDSIISHGSTYELIAIRNSLFDRIRNYELGNLLMKSDDKGLTWKYCTAPDLNQKSLGVGVTRSGALVTVFSRMWNPDRNIYISIYRSTDQGITWTDTSEFIVPTAKARFYSLPSGDILLKSKNQLYRSKDDGASWQGLKFYAESIVILDSGRIVAAQGRDLFLSNDNGYQWHLISTTSIMERKNLVKDSKNTLYCTAVNDNHIGCSKDEGVTWKYFPQKGQYNYSLVKSLAVNSRDELFAILNYDSWLGRLSIFRSTDLAETWTYVCDVPGKNSLQEFYFDRFDNAIIATSDQVWKLPDGGNVPISMKFSTTQMPTSQINGITTTPDGAIYVAASDGVYRLQENERVGKPSTKPYNPLN